MDTGGTFALYTAPPLYLVPSFILIHKFILHSLQAFCGISTFYLAAKHIPLIHKPINMLVYPCLLKHKFI